MNVRYHSLNDHLTERFGTRVYKVTLESGCGCPNRDGTRGVRGCSFCNERSYSPATNPHTSPRPPPPLRVQLEEGSAYVRRRHGAEKFIAYFQRGSNTYGPVERLRALYTEAIAYPEVVGCAISTRPDCCSRALCDMIAETARRTYCWVELGLQSAHEATLNRIGRGHTVDEFARAHELCASRGIPVCAHVIVGLPGETRAHLIETARFLNTRGVWGVKIHNLHVLEHTALADEYRAGAYCPLTLETYAQWTVDFLERLSPATVIHRVNSHSPRALTVAPEWSVNKLAIFNAVEAEMERRDTWQGRCAS